MQYELRELTVNDLPGLSKWGVPFYEEANFPGIFNPEMFVYNWSVLLNAGIGIILGLLRDGTLVGTIGALITPDVNTGDRIATETFWFVHRDHRGAGILLLDAMEKWAREQGVKRINVAHPSTPSLERLSAIYKRRGYRPVEVHYTKEA